MAVYPTGSDGARIGAGYLADVDTFGNGASVPVFGFTATDWPQQATHAEVHVAVQRESVEPTDTMRLSELHLEGATRHDHRPLTGLQGVVAHVIVDAQQSNQLTIIEKHEADSPGLDAIVVRLQSNAGLVRKIRRIDPESRLVTTIFKSDSSGTVNLANDVVEFLLQDDLQRKSLHLLKPVTLSVSTNNGLLIPTSR
ncbi:MAG: hypothetical protein RIK87_02820 [Fuerstiella sp.]